jgi:predicted kinase
VARTQSPRLPGLIVIRGNSGSGKSTIARAPRLRLGRGCALVEQDYLRRVLLREHESSQTPAAAELIGMNARFALDRGYHTIVEGILDRHRYGPMLGHLIEGHAGPTSVYYLEVSWEETLRRHETRPQAADFTGSQMRAWYRPHDVLGRPGEVVIAEHSTAEQTIALIAGRVEVS